MVRSDFEDAVVKAIMQNAAYVEDEAWQVVVEFPRSVEAAIKGGQAPSFVAGKIVACWNMQGRMPGR